jgi:hypothetical protein
MRSTAKSTCFPVYPQYQTFDGAVGTTVSCHKRSLPRGRTLSIYRLRLRKFSTAVEDFGARPIEAHHVIPARQSRQAIDNLAVAATELNGHRAARVLLRRDTVQRKALYGFRSK